MQKNTFILPSKFFQAASHTHMYMYRSTHTNALATQHGLCDMCIILATQYIVAVQHEKEEEYAV